MKRSRDLGLVICLLFLIVVFSPQLYAQEPASPSQIPSDFEKDQEGASIIRERSDWFYQQRAYPHAKIPPGARLSALRELDRKLGAEHSHQTIGPLAAQTPVWTFIGPQPINTPYTDPVVAGRVAAIAIDPTNTKIVYLGAAQGGVWKTTNGGTTWTELTDTQSSLAVGSIAIDPANHLNIYVGTGEENFSGDSYYGAGILKSTNGGASWTQICGPFCGPVGQDGYYGGGARIGGLAIHPTNSSVLLAAVQLLYKDGIYRSADGGATWTQVLGGNPGTAVVFDPSNGNIAFAALGDSFSGGTEGVYKSTDGGLTWSAVNGTGTTALPLQNAGRIVLAMAPSNPNAIYAGVDNLSTSGLLGFFRTTDGGNSWTPLTSTPDYCTPQCWYDHVIAVQPTNSNVVYAGGAFSTTLVRSLDGGTTWATLQSAEQGGLIHADVHALTFTPDGTQLFVGSDGGAYSTLQPAANDPAFTAWNNTLGITQFYPGLAIHPTNPAIALGGTQDNGTLLYSGSPTWNQVTCGDGGYTAIDPVTPSTMYATCQDINILKSTASGAPGTWSASVAGISTSDRSQFIPPLVIDPSMPERLYFGTYRVYQTANEASSWTAISPNLTNGGNLTTMAVAPTDSNTVYTGSSDSQVFVTSNAGAGASAAWRNITTGLPPRFITQVAVDPKSAETAYVTFSGFTGFGDTLGHVFKITSGSTEWADISGDLPNTPVNSIVIDPDLPGYLFAGTDVGVFYTTNGGGSWNSLVSGLPRVAVLGLTLNNTSYTLRAATHGRGVWDLDITTVVPIVGLTSISPTNVMAGAPSLTLTVTGKNFISTSVVRWNGVNLATTFVSGTSLTATVPSSDLTTAAAVLVTVFNPGTPGLVSRSAIFDVDNPLPALTSISPTSESAGGAPFKLTVSGTGFVSQSTIQWNGTSLATNFVSATQLTANVPAANVANAGTAKITVLNGAPGGGTSNAATLTINAFIIVPTALQFIPVTPCRVADTRNPAGPFGGPELAANSTRSFDVPQSACGIPSTAAAYSLNVTVVPNASLNYLTILPAGETQPYVSTLNSDGRVKANAAIVPAGTDGAVSVYVTDATQVILDIDGYFVPTDSNSSALAFYPLTPCRIADTRNASGPLGGPSITGGSSRAFPILSSTCNIPSSARAYSLNVTAIPHKTLNYVTTWPTGQAQPNVSTLNAPTGTIVANAAIVPAGTTGQVSIFVSDTSDVILDVNGYFAPPATGGLSLYTVSPCRVIDTRPNAFNGVLPVNVEGSACAPPSAAEAYVLNATVVPRGALTYLTLWPAGETQPNVSTLNALDGAITSNMAIVPTTNGSIDAFSSNPTNLILDISSYFAP